MSRINGAELVEGVYLCDTLDMSDIFDAALVAHPELRLYKPEDVPDPARIRFALVWHPGQRAFAPFPNIELVQVIGAGVDGVLRNQGLPPEVCVARVLDEEQASIMAGFAAWHVIWHHRQMGNYLAAQADALWQRHSVKTLRPPSQVTVGVLGYGRMGERVARTVASMGFPVLAASRSAGPAPVGITRISGENAIQTVAAQADILINILPLTPETHDVLNAALFARMPKGAILIHLGRGPHMVEDDLLAALEAGHLGGASLDVFQCEPLPEDHPFWKHPQIVITPHEASVSAPAAVAQTLALSVQELVAGIPLSAAVDRNAGY